MAWDAKAKGVAIKAIGTVESGMRYDDINHRDPITIGIGQWFGGRAYNLLARIKREAPDEYAKLPAELRSRVDANNTDWPHYYLPNYMDGQVKPVLRACYKIQQNQMAEDLEAYVAIARKLGFDPDRDTQSMIFFFVAYHQTPVRAMRIANQIGPATLDRWHAATLNEPIFGRYRNRYNTAYNIIKAWNSDGVDIAGPPGASPSNPTQGDGGNGAPGANQPLANNNSTGQLARVEAWGNAVIAHMADGKQVQCAPTGWGQYVAGPGGAGTPPPTNNAPGGQNGAPGTGGGGGALAPGTSETRQKLVYWMASRENKFRYSNGAGRLDPDRSGVGDCSSTCRRAYLDVCGIDIGGNTVAQSANGHGVFVINWNTARSISAQQLALMKPGDLVFYDWGSGRAGVDHVEMYAGGDLTWGHGGGLHGEVPGPHKNSLSKFIRDTRGIGWCVKRYIND